MLSHITKLNFENKIMPIIGKCFSPIMLGNVVTKMPFVVNQMLIEKILNSVLSEQIQDGELDFLSERQLQIEIIDANIFLGVSFKNKQLCCTHFNEQTIDFDTALSINTLDAILLIEQEIDPDTLFFQRKLKIRGDTELAHHVKNTIDTLEPDAIPKFLLKFLSYYKQQILQ